MPNTVLPNALISHLAHGDRIAAAHWIDSTHARLVSVQGRLFTLRYFYDRGWLVWQEEVREG